MSETPVIPSPFKSALGNVAKKFQPEAQPSQIDIERSQPKAKTAAARTPGKSSNDDYVRTTVYLPKTMRDDLARKLVGTDQDMSDVLEGLLSKHLYT